MFAFLILFLCSVQGFSSAVQTYSELIYPVPRHKVRNLENPVPELSPASFQCSKNVPCGYCGPLDRPVNQYSSVTRYTEGSDVHLSAQISDRGKGSIQVSLCVRNDSLKNEKEACVQDIQLYIPETNDVTVPVTPSEEMSFSARLPRGITCENCILRWSLIEADPTCSECTLTTINCADISIDARAIRRKRQSGPKKSKKKTKKTKKTKMPLLPLLPPKKTTTAPTKSTTRAPSFFEMVKQIVARQQVDPNLQNKGLNVVRNTQPPPNHYGSAPLYVTPKVNQAYSIVPPVQRRQSRVRVTPSPPAYANLKNVPNIPNSNYVRKNNKWQPQTRYPSSVNTLEKTEFRDKDGIIQKAAPSNAFLEAIRRFKKEKMGLDEMIHNDKPQMGEFHDNVDITRVKKVEKPGNLMPSDNALVDKGKYQKGILPSKYDYFDKTPKTQAPTTTTKKTTTKPNPTTAAPTTVRTRPTKKAGVRNLARNTFLEAIMKLTGKSSAMSEQNVNSRNIQNKEPTYSSVNEIKQVHKIDNTQNKQIDTKDPFTQAIKQVEHQKKKILQETEEIQSKRITTEPSSTLSPTSKSTLKSVSKKGLLPKWDSKKTKKTKSTTTSTTQSTSSTTKYTKAQMSTRYDPSYETTTGINVYNPQENPLPDVLPIESDPYMNFFVILPPMNKGNEETASGTTALVDQYPAQDFTTADKANRESTSQSTLKSTKPSTEQQSQSIDYTPSKTTLQPTYRTHTTPKSDVNSISTLKKVTEKKSSASGLLARLAAKDTTKTKKTTTTKKVTSPDYTPSKERFTSPLSDTSLSTSRRPLITDKVTSSPYSSSNEKTKQSKSSPFLPFKENTEQPKTTFSSTTTFKAKNENVGLLNMDSLITDKVTSSPYTPFNDRTKQSNSSPFLPFKENTEQPKTIQSSTTTRKYENENIGLLNMGSLMTGKVTSSPYSSSNERNKQSKFSPFFPLKENTKQPKSTPSSITTPKEEEENLGLLNMDLKPKSLLDKLPMSNTKDKSMHSKQYSASPSTVSSTTQLHEETPINDVSALAFKELFEPDTFKELQNKTTKNVHSTLTTKEIPSTSITKGTSDSATYSKLESTQATSSPRLHAEMHKNNYKAQSYDLLEKELHDKIVDSKPNTRSSVPVYLDTIHADMYKTKTLDEKSKSESAARKAAAPSEGKKPGRLLPLLGPMMSEKKKKSGFLLPMPEMPAKSSIDYRSNSKSSMTTARTTVTQAPFTSPSSTPSQTTRTSTAPFESSLMEKMREIQELQLQKLQREIENLKMKLLEIHQYSMTSRVPITQPRTTPMPTTTTTPLPTTTTTQKPTTTTRKPTTQKPTTLKPTTTKATTTTTKMPTTIVKTTTQKPTTTTEIPTTTTQPSSITTTITQPKTTPEEPSTTTTEIPTTTTTYMTTSTVPTTTTESIAVLMRNFLKIFRPMLYRELHMSPQQRVTEPAIIPMTMVKRTTRSPTTYPTTTQRPTTASPTTHLTTTQAPTTTYSPTTTTTTYSPTTTTATTTTTTPEPATTKTTLSEKLILKQLLMEHHPDVYNRLYRTQTQGLARFETTKTTAYPTTDPLTTDMDQYTDLMDITDLSSSPPISSSSTTSMRTTKQTTTKSTTTIPTTTTTSTTVTTTTPQPPPPTTTTTESTTTSTTTATTPKLITITNKKTTLPQTNTEISFYEFLEKAKLANIPIPSKIREELRNVFEKSTTKSTTTRFTTRPPEGKPIPVDPVLLVDFDRPKTPSPVRRWKPPAPIEIFKVQSTQAFTTPRRTTTTTRKTTTVTPAPTTTTKTPIAEILQKYREMYEQGVDKQKIVQSIFKNIDIDTLMENKALFNDILSPQPSSRQANYSPSTTLGYRFDTEHNYGPSPVNYDSHNYGPSAVHNQNNMIHYSERQSNRDGSPGLSAYDNRVMGIPVVPFDSKSTSQPFRFAPSFRIDSQEPIGWPSQVNGMQMREYINNGDLSGNNVEKGGYGPYETIQGSFDSVAAGNPNSGFLSNNNEGYHPNTRPPVLQLENTVATRHSGLSAHNHGPLVVGPSGSLMDLGMVNKLHNAERPGGGAVIMSKSLGANMVLHAQDTIGGGTESGTLSQNPHDLGPQDFTMKRHSGSLSNTAGHAGGSHLSAPGASLSGERFRLRRSTRNHYPDPHRRREYMLEEQYIVTDGGKLTCAAGEKLECVGIGEFKDVAGINWFCLSMCEGDRCPRNKCQCGCRDEGTDTWRPLPVK